MKVSLDVSNKAGITSHKRPKGDFMLWDEMYSRAKSWGQAIPADDPNRLVFGIHAENGIDTILQFLAVLFAGGIPAPLAPSTDVDTRDSLLKSLGASGLWNNSVGWIRLPGSRRYNDGFDIVMHSSGSTGVPKALAITLSSMKKNARDVAGALKIDHNDIHIGTYSQCYMSGLYNATLLPLITGGRVVSVPITTPLTAKDLIAAIKEHRPTVLWTSPLIARMLHRLEGIPNDVMNGIRFAVSCTATLQKEDKERFEEKFHIPLLQSYGLCETLITTMEDPDDPAAGSVGRPLGGKGAVIVKDGRVIISNGAVFAGYIREAESGSFVPSEERFITEDMGRFDKKGNLVIEGRASEVINRDGIKFLPSSVEDKIALIPGVSECAVVGIEDGSLGARIVAWVSGSNLDRKKLQSEFRKRLRPVERPHDIVIVDRLPRTTSGKVDRFSLRTREAGIR
ncbi:MAG: acyl--CoA ligase [Candidatus Omnitrophica bacterium]|nr:acyl--CoA ligase [Candidatus Omnitrophota bacterium]